VASQTLEFAFADKEREEGEPAWTNRKGKNMTNKTRILPSIALTAIVAWLGTSPLVANANANILVPRGSQTLYFNEADIGTAPGMVGSISKAPVHGALTFDGSSFQFTPALSFWTVGGDHFEVTMSGLGPTANKVVTLTAASSASEVFQTSFEPGDPLPFPRANGSSLNIGPEGAVVFENGILLQAGPSAPNRAGGYDWTDMAFSPVCQTLDPVCLGGGNGGSGEIHVTLEEPPPPLQGFAPSFVTLLRAVDASGTAIADLQLSFDGIQTATLQAKLVTDLDGDILVTGGPNPVTIGTAVAHRLRLDVWTGLAGGLMVSIDDRVVLSLQDYSVTRLIDGFDLGMLDGVSASSFDLNVDHLRVTTNGEAPDGVIELADNFLGGLGSWAEVWEVAGPISADGDLEVTITDSSAWASFLRDPAPSQAKRYHVRFKADTSLLTMPIGGQMYMLVGYPDDPVANNHLQLRLRRAGNDFEIRADAKDDSGSLHATAWHLLPRGEHVIEAQWRAATAVGTADGYIRFFVDGVYQDEAPHIPNAGRVIETIRFGLLGVDTATSGTITYDDFVSWTDTREQQAP